MPIVLVSGGLDSATALAWSLKNLSGRTIPISFAYGQRHSREIVCAEKLCEYYSLPAPRIINLSQAFHVIGGSSLTSGVREGNPSEECVSRTPSDLPPTFVPGRNIIMLAVAASIGYVEREWDVVGGWNALDYSGYPDCRPDFIDAMSRALREGLMGNTFIHAPLVQLTKIQIIQLGMELSVPYELTWSCYSGGVTPCGECDSCKIRAAGFESVGVPDPALTTS